MTVENIDSDQCSLCGKQFDLDTVERWGADANHSVELRGTSEVLACANTTLGELDICEECYLRRNKFHLMSPSDRREIHDQFGLEYQHRKNWLSSIEAFSKAAEINRDADVLLSMGGSYEGLNDPQMAKKCYSEALTLEPDNRFARENLARLRLIDE